MRSTLASYNQTVICTAQPDQQIQYDSIVNSTGSWYFSGDVSIREVFVLWPTALIYPPVMAGTATYLGAAYCTPRIVHQQTGAQAWVSCASLATRLTPPNLPTRDGLRVFFYRSHMWITFPVSLTTVDHMATFDLCRSMQRLWWLRGWYKSLRRSKRGDTVSVWRLWVSKGEQCIQCIQGGTNCQRLWRLWDKVQRVHPNKSCWVLSLLVYWSFSVSLCF